MTLLWFCMFRYMSIRLPFHPQSYILPFLSHGLHSSNVTPLVVFFSLSSRGMYINLCVCIIRLMKLLRVLPLNWFVIEWYFLRNGITFYITFMCSRYIDGVVLTELIYHTQQIYQWPSIYHFDNRVIYFYINIEMIRSWRQSKDVHNPFRRCEPCLLVKAVCSSLQYITRSTAPLIFGQQTRTHTCVNLIPILGPWGNFTYICQ